MPSESDKPDILVVLVDQLARNALGGNGDPNVRTPQLDRMAEEGMVFEAMSSTFPACVPFRFSMMTGQFAHSRMVPGLGYRMSPAERTLGEAVKSAGYKTGYIGKWHLYSLFGVVGGQTLRQANRHPVPASHRRGWDHWRGFELRNDFFDTCVFHDDDPTPVPLKGYQTDALFDLAEEWIDRPSEQPVFTILSPEAPHPPFTAPQAAVDSVRQRGPYRPRPNVDVDAVTAFPPEWDEMARQQLGVPISQVSPEQRRWIFDEGMQTYCAMIEVIDTRMGRLLDRLRAPGARRTIVVFLSDHGELGGSHGMLGKAEPYEESIGVPLFFWSNDPALVPAGRRTDFLACTEDLFPTLVGLAGGKEGGPGQDLTDLVSGADTPPDRDAVLIEFTAETRPARRHHDMTWRGVRTRKMKYVVQGNANGAHPWMCFDLENDPYEMENLVESVPQDPRIAMMHDTLIRALKDSEDDFPMEAI